VRREVGGITLVSMGLGKLLPRLPATNGQVDEEGTLADDHLTVLHRDHRQLPQPLQHVV